MTAKRGLRAEVVIHLGVLLAAALLFFGLVLLKVAERELLQGRVRQAADVTALVAETLRLHPGETPAEAAERALRLLQQRQQLLDLRGALVVDARLQPLRGWGDTSSLPMIPELQRARLTGETQLELNARLGWLPLEGEDRGQLRVTVSLSAEGDAPAAVQVEFGLQRLWPQPWFAINTMLLYATLFGLCLLLFGLTLLEGSVIRPVQRLLAAVRQVAEHRFDGRVAIARPREIAELATAFNTMTAALAQEQQRTAATIDSLESANAELRLTREELIRAEKLASVGQLAAGMAHEIGNPLGASLGYLEYLKAELGDAGQREILDRSLTELGRIDRLIRDLLDFAAPGPSELEWLEPAGVAREAVELLRHQGALKQVALADDLPPRLAQVHLSRHKLLQVLVNLLLNARDAVEPDGQIRLSAARQGDRLLLTVADDGDGLSEEVRLRLFDPFFTTKAPGRGRGLGLSVCQRVMLAAGGQIRVESVAGAGSRFTLELPCREETEA